MSDAVRKLARVRSPAEDFAGDADADFSAATEPFQRELLAHCYRMTGSLHDAEDLVQETFLRAWKAYDRFEGKSSVRTWLHRIGPGGSTPPTPRCTTGSPRCWHPWSRPPGSPESSAP
jgi:RNA polymerase sigma-70 factor, ECF subfamily